MHSSKDHSWLMIIGDTTAQDIGGIAWLLQRYGSKPFFCPVMMVVYAFQWFLLGLAPWCSIYFHITNFLCASDVTYFKKWQVAFFWGGTVQISSVSKQLSILSSSKDP